MQTYVIKKEKHSFTQSKELIEASYTLGFNEKRLLMLGISKINPEDFPVLHKPYSFEITAAEWSFYFCQDKQPYQSIKRACNNILGRTFTLNPKVGIVRKVSWFDSVDFIEGQGKVLVTFGYGASVHLSGALEEYASIKLIEVCFINTFLGLRLYELLMQFKKSRWRVLNLNDFRIALDCVDAYPQTKELKRNVLNPALKEVNKNSPITVKCEDIKTGNKITGFRFSYAWKKDWENEWNEKRRKILQKKAIEVREIKDVIEVPELPKLPEVNQPIVSTPCPLCSKPMVEKKGKNGAFMGCTGFPACKGSASIFAPDMDGYNTATGSLERLNDSSWASVKYKSDAEYYRSGQASKKRLKDISW